MKNKKNLLYVLISLLLFAVIALVYCSPVLSGKSVIQPDIINYRGSAQEMLTYQDKTGENVYWSDAMFGGMPTYQTGAKYDFDIIKTIDGVFRFLPRPADYIFLLFTGFFILGLTLFKKWQYALVGAIFFAFSSYYFELIAAGHNGKLHTIGYFAPFVAGILLLYRKKYIAGFVLTTLFMGLQLQANHIQMTFYLFLAMLVFAIVQFIDSLKKKELPDFLKSSALVVVALIIAAGLNANRLLSTYEYSKETTRGKSEMTLLKKNSNGLDHDYITQWSYGKLETLNLFIPNLMGGGSQTNPEDLKNYTSELQNTQYSLGEDEFNQQVFQAVASQPRSAYWGDQPGTSGPAYQGAVVVFLFIIGMFMVRGKYATYKKWLVGATILSFILAWGKNLPFVTNLFIDYFPMYDKFRAVSSILVIAEFTMPFLAILTLYYFFNLDESDDFKKKVLYIAGGSTIGILIIFFLFGGMIFPFTSENEKFMTEQLIGQIQQANPNAVGLWDGLMKRLDEALIQDRISMFKADTLRTLIFVLCTMGLLLAYLFKLIKKPIVVILTIGALAFIDGFTVNKRYLNEDNFVSKYIVDNPFPTEMSPRLQTEAENNNNVAQIAYKVPLNNLLSNIAKQDQSHFRVYNTVLSTFNEAGTSYFVPSIGGYHAAKLGKYQDVVDIYFSQDPQLKKYGIKDETGLINVLNMMNTKYIIHGSPTEPQVQQNPTALGSAWLASNIKWTENANDEILAINSTPVDHTVILRKDLVENKNLNVSADANSKIELVDYSPMKMTYKSSSNTDQIAVFSEVYYPHGWIVTVDGKEVPIEKANYVLRAVPVQKGNHTIVMEFKPQVISTGNMIVIVSNILLLIVVAGGIYLGYKKCSIKENLNLAAEKA
ncbi:MULTISPECIES: YfhO family protein [unclassified Empedobacter]|uniref:YfhO family protein n=1 Tax=unclassified Empedobacter TaxID=2643773 RepID=UPI0025C2E976|nr:MULTISPECIES: YfhO family protein [unclassified Empedobacter]